MTSGGSYDPLSIIILVHLRCTKRIFSLRRRLFAIIADLDQQFHGWSIDAIDNHDGCVVFLQKLEEHTVWDDLTVVAADPLIIPNREERGVMVAVGIDDGTWLETAEFIGFCDGDEFAVHSWFSFLLESHDFELARQLVRDEFNHLFYVFLNTGIANPVARFAVVED